MEIENKPNNIPPPTKIKRPNLEILRDAKDPLYLDQIPLKEYDSMEAYKLERTRLNKEVEQEIKQQKMLNPLSWQEFNKLEFPKTRYRIERLVPLGGFTIIAAPSGEKKTWLAMEMARCIASGTPFLNDSLFPVIAGNVLYIDQEMAKSEFQKRARMLGFGDVDKELWIISRDELNLNTPEGADALLELIHEKDISTVIIDTLRAVAGGLKEEKADEIRTFFNRFKLLKDKGVSIIFLDHCRKPQQYEGKIPKKEQLFASQDKTASVEVLLMLRSEPNTEEIRIYQLKNRGDKELAPFKIVLEDELDSKKNRVKLSYAGEIEEDHTKKEEAKEHILAILSEGGKTTPELIDICRSNKIGAKNVRQAVRELEEGGKINGQKQGSANYYTLSANEDIEPKEQLTL